MGPIFAALIAVSGFSDPDLTHYLHLRKQYGIHTAADEPALESFVGTRVVEIAGVVNGVIGVKGQTSLLLQKPVGPALPVRVDTVPSWLYGNSVEARLLVRAYRRSPESKLEVRLLDASQEAPIAQVEADEQAREVAEAARRAKVAASRSFHIPTTVAARKRWWLPASEAEGYYAAFIQRVNPRLTSNKALSIARAVLGFSIHFGVDARLIMAILMAESEFNPHATSRAGAMGLGQLMPSTAQWMGVTNAYDTTDNLYGTVKMVRINLDNYRAKTGDAFQGLVLALAAYNAGDGAVARHHGVPPYRETQAYVRKVIRLYRQYRGY